MKKVIVAIVVTILVMLQLFYYMLVNATATFGYTIDGRQIVSITTWMQTFNYWEVK